MWCHPKLESELWKEKKIKTKIVTNRPTAKMLQGTNAVLSGLLAVTLYIQYASFICLFSYTVCIPTKKVLTRIDFFIVEGYSTKIGSVICFTIVRYLRFDIDGPVSYIWILCFPEVLYRGTIFLGFTSMSWFGE